MRHPSLPVELPGGSAGAGPVGPMTAGTLTSQALLNCLIREVSAPERQTWTGGGHVIVRLARSGSMLRAAVQRPSAALGPRLTGQVHVCRDGHWAPIGWIGLAGLIAAELTMATGVTNDEFIGQVRASHIALTAILAARQAHRVRQVHLARAGLGGPGHLAPGHDASSAGPAGGAGGAGGAGDAGRRVGQYLVSEQALVAGHRFHPAPKARCAAVQDWLRYAPEAGARFPLRFLGVRADVLAEEGDTTALERLGGPEAPPGHRLLPVHPWQLSLLEQRPWFAPARRGGLLTDLGPGSRDVWPTSSVRTVYDPGADVFAKFSLDVRITNCVRTSAWHELAGSVVLSGLLRPVFRDLRGRFPGTVLLAEPGYRTVALARREACEGLAVIVRDGLRRSLPPGVTPLLAAALAEPGLTGPGPAQRLFGGRDPDWLLGWWDAYVRHLVPPVLHALFAHGVVLEPHLQNVLVGVDAGGWPEQVIFRDLEGVKLVAARHEQLLGGLPSGVARGLAYDRERGWNRVAYCLIVNHLAEIAAAVADHCPGQQELVEAALWDRLRRSLAAFARQHGWTPELRALLAGAPLPAKANLKVRWVRAGDRDACYVPVRNPMQGGPLEGKPPGAQEANRPAAADQSIHPAIGPARPGSPQ